ncbi:MAG TPA: hypothetical protein VGE08_17485 [Steroidobacter sp.]
MAGRLGRQMVRKQVEHVGARLRTRRHAQPMSRGILRKHFGEPKRALLDLHHHEGARLARLGEVRRRGRQSKGRADTLAADPKINANAIRAGRGHAAGARRSSAPTTRRSLRVARAACSLTHRKKTRLSTGSALAMRVNAGPPWCSL